MPDSADFLRGFGLAQGSHVSGYLIEKAVISHNEEIHYRKYNYPMQLTFRYAGPDIETNEGFFSFYRELDRLISRTLTINSRYGNPYSCSITYESAQRNPDGTLLFILKGHSQRI